MYPNRRAEQCSMCLCVCVCVDHNVVTLSLPNVECLSCANFFLYVCSFTYCSFFYIADFFLFWILFATKEVWLLRVSASATDQDACIRLIFHCLAKLFLTDTRHAEKCVKQVPRSNQPTNHPRTRKKNVN